MALTSVALTSARALLNDDSATLYSDSFLIPKLVIAHRELQKILKSREALVMIKISGDLDVAMGATVLTVPPADLIQPIRLWEKAPADPQSSYVMMTGRDPLPKVAQGATLIYWGWDSEQVTFVGATGARKVVMRYWRSITTPSSGTDPIGIIDGEIYLAPRTAALTALSLGNKDRHDDWTQQALSSIEEVVISNMGRSRPEQSGALRP